MQWILIMVVAWLALGLLSKGRLRAQVAVLGVTAAALGIWMVQILGSR